MVCGIEANVVNIINSCSKAYSPCNVTGPRLELVRGGIVGSMLESNRFDHIASTLVGWHILQMHHFSVHNANAGRRKYFMSRKDIKITVDLLNKRLKVGRRL